MHSKKSKRLCEAANGSDWMPCLMQELPTDTEPFNLLMIVTGKTDEICGKYSYQLDDYMNKRGIEHIFYETTGGHQTVVWQNALYNYAKKCKEAVCKSIKCTSEMIRHLLCRSY